jgi:hypothetical protein
MEENIKRALTALHLEERRDKAEAVLEKMLLHLESAERRVAVGAALPSPLPNQHHL